MDARRSTVGRRVQSMSLKNESSERKLFLLRKGTWQHSKGKISHLLGLDERVFHTMKCPTAM